jgi:ABC-type transport system involved in multi-copper enzyme maturation permease subunit
LNHVSPQDRPSSPANRGWENLRLALVITRREMRDQFRDWRIILPMLMLTLIFPWLMDFTASQAVRFVERYNAPEIGLRLIPFLLMVVGFFPISVSLVIALESFVGEKERRSIEPLLCSPLSDGQLYVGKLLAAMMPPLMAAYLGISVYLIGIYLNVGWKPPAELLAQILLLTSVQAVLMVSGAVVISSQTTSVRAANLLASFIIIPMAMLIQGESILMFWGLYRTLWWAVVGQMIIAILLVRTGVAYFNREEMLGRELDVLNFRWAWIEFRRNFSGDERSLWGWYRHQVFPGAWGMRLPIVVTTAALLIAILAGLEAARQLRLPPELVSFDNLGQGFIQGLDAFKFISPAGVLTIWLHNLRALLIATILGVFTFGVLGLLVMMLPMAFLSYVAGNIAITGGSPLMFALALVVPHGFVEIPAIILGGAAILSLGATLTAPTQGQTLGQAFVVALARWAKVTAGLVVPLFLLAAILEVYLTPRIAVWLLGR